jgi:energy-coupling factor transporter ATP-binding protein EcfA2
VLACKPTIIVMDEPTANLDPRARRRFIELTKSLEMTKVIVTHDLEMVLEICGRAILLDGGKVVADGVPRQLLSDKELVEAHGLEVPVSLACK